MAKQPTITTVATGYNSNTVLNNNFNNIQAAFENTLSRDGSTPNAMAADLDMNNNDILNADVVDCETLNLNGNMITSIPTTVTFGDSTYNLNTSNSDDRTITQRMRDRSSVKDFGVVGDGVTSDTTKLQDAYTDTSLMWFPSGTYVSSNLTVPGGTVLEADVDATLEFTFNAPLRKGNRFTFGGDYEPTLGQLGHPAPNKGNSWQNALQVTRGTQTTPDTTALYARTAAYVEMHSARNLTAAQSSYGSAFLLPALSVEHQAHTGTECSAAAGAFRAFSTVSPTNSATGKKNLVGVTGLGQTAPGAGNDTFNVWGGNFIASQVSGNKPDNCVGIEVDLVHTSDHVVGSGGPPSPTTGNFTAYWAQSDAKGGAYSSAAFYASRTLSSGGWNWVLYAAVAAKQWSIYIDNPETTGTAGGLFLRTSASGGKIMEVEYDTGSGSINQFEITPDATDAVWVKVAGTLRKIVAGAADSGGAGFRMLRVVN